jgi:hypothetical protein
MKEELKEKAGPKVLPALPSMGERQRSYSKNSPALR